MSIDVTKLLDRKEIKLDTKVVSEQLNGKTILITGAGGSIGSEICRQVMKFGPKKLILLGHGENSIYEIDMELREADFERSTEIVPVIAEIQDQSTIHRIFDEHRPQIVYHAAAHKHVPLMEAHPTQAVKNNIFGTCHVVLESHLSSVETFVMISSDKAVNPTSIMGATKRAAEMIIQTYNDLSPTKFVAVRFGNVLGSRGSVVPRFEKQIAKGGPITVTHEEMTRYFMTIPEASRLVVQAGSLALGGEIFILDMGKPVKIVDLAYRMIVQSGRTGRVKVQFTGLRPGEKMYEELMTSEEGLDSTSHNKIFIGKRTDFSSVDLIRGLRGLVENLDNKRKLIQALQKIVPTYTSGDFK